MGPLEGSDLKCNNASQTPALSDFHSNTLGMCRRYPRVTDMETEAQTAGEPGLASWGGQWQSQLAKESARLKATCSCNAGPARQTANFPPEGLLEETHPGNHLPCTAPGVARASDHSTQTQEGSSSPQWLTTASIPHTPMSRRGSARTLSHFTNWETEAPK